MAAGNLDVLVPGGGYFRRGRSGDLLVVRCPLSGPQCRPIRWRSICARRSTSALQYQGSSFFNRYTIGDMMTRAVADISLIQRLIAMGSILLVILVYATSSASASCSTCRRR